jgi:hypothetical protein
VTQYRSKGRTDNAAEALYGRHAPVRHGTAGEKEMPEDAERKGIGTPATRAGILEKLVAGGFVERRKGKKRSISFRLMQVFRLSPCCRSSSSLRFSPQNGKKAQAGGTRRNERG